MKLLQLSSYFKPESLASPYLNENLREDIVKAGIEMAVLVPCPSRAIPDDVRKLYKNKRLEFFYEGKLSVHRFPLMKEGKNPIFRAIRYFLQCFKQFYYVVFSKIGRDVDVMLVSSTPPILPPTVAAISKWTGIPYVYELQDIFPDSLAGTGLAKKNGILYKIGNVIANYGYKHAQRIIVIGEDFKRNLIEKGVPEEKIEVVYNWVDENAVVPVAKEDNPLFEEFGISREKFHVVYAGNLGNAQNIDVIVDSAKELAGETDIEFLIFGTGGLKEQFVEKVKAYGIDNVKFFPLQPMERVSQVYGLGDVCVVSCKPGLGGAAMPSKMLSIMSAGRAVVASFDKGELTYILEQNKCGMYAPAGDVKAFASLIEQMADNREECQKMGENARQLILKKFTRDFGTSEYVRIIKSVCASDNK